MGYGELTPQHTRGNLHPVKMSDKKCKGKTESSDEELPDNGSRKAGKIVSNRNVISSVNKSDNPVNKEETNPDGNSDWKLTDDYSGIQEVALDELDTAENKKEELSENTEEEETEKKDNDVKELKKKEVSTTLIVI